MVRGQDIPAMEPFLQQRTATVGWLIFLSVSRKDNIYERE